MMAVRRVFVSVEGDIELQEAGRSFAEMSETVSHATKRNLRESRGFFLPLFKTRARRSKSLTY